jgi:hypothetical protein
MKLTDKEIDAIVAKVANRVVGVLNKENDVETLLVPVLENQYESTDFNNIVSLGTAFSDLNTHDKLLVVKGAIRTHYQLFKGVIMPFGQIISYNLQMGGRCYYFEPNGRLSQECLDDF